MSMSLSQSSGASGVGRGRNRIRAVVRCRPITDDDFRCCKLERHLLTTCVGVKPDKRSVVVTKDTYITKEMQFDQSYGVSADQEHIYDRACKDIVADAFSGYQSSILSYGQTGSGKSFTMFGSGFDVTSERGSLERLPGIAQFAITDLFAMRDARQAAGLYCSLQLSMFQIYKEGISDLLVPSAHTASSSSQELFSVTQSEKEESMALFHMRQRLLDIREYPDKSVVIEGLSHYPVNTFADAMALLSAGLANRVTRSVTANEQSSRSHVILQLSVTCQEMVHDGGTYDHKVRTSSLLLVDLAGSERVRKSGSINDARTMNEAQSINKSISTLGLCIHTLATAGDKGMKAAHVPFRNSKLTRLLAESIGGRARACIIATIGPCLYNVEETLSTLMFAKRCTAVKKLVRRVNPVLPDLFDDNLIGWTWHSRQQDHQQHSPGTQSEGNREKGSTDISVMPSPPVMNGSEHQDGSSSSSSGYANDEAMSPSSTIDRLFAHIGTNNNGDDSSVAALNTPHHLQHQREFPGDREGNSADASVVHIPTSSSSPGSDAGTDTGPVTATATARWVRYSVDEESSSSPGGFSGGSIVNISPVSPTPSHTLQPCQRQCQEQAGAPLDCRSLHTDADYDNAISLNSTTSNPSGGSTDFATGCPTSPDTHYSYSSHPESPSSSLVFGSGRGLLRKGLLVLLPESSIVRNTDKYITINKDLLYEAAAIDKGTIDIETGQQEKGEEEGVKIPLYGTGIINTDTVPASTGADTADADAEVFAALTEQRCSVEHGSGTGNDHDNGRVQNINSSFPVSVAAGDGDGGSDGDMSLQDAEALFELYTGNNIDDDNTVGSEYEIDLNISSSSSDGSRSPVSLDEHGNVSPRTDIKLDLDEDGGGWLGGRDFSDVSVSNVHTAPHHHDSPREGEGGGSGSDKSVLVSRSPARVFQEPPDCDDGGGHWYAIQERFDSSSSSSSSSTQHNPATFPTPLPPSNTVASSVEVEVPVAVTSPLRPPELSLASHTVSGINSPKNIDRKKNMSPTSPLPISTSSRMVDELSNIFEGEADTKIKSLFNSSMNIMVTGDAVIGTPPVIPKLEIPPSPAGENEYGGRRSFSCDSQDSSSSASDWDSGTDRSDFMALMTDSPPSRASRAAIQPPLHITETTDIPPAINAPPVDIKDRIDTIQSTQETLRYIMKKLETMYADGEMRLAELMLELHHSENVLSVSSSDDSDSGDDGWSEDTGSISTAEHSLELRLPTSSHAPFPIASIETKPAIEGGMPVELAMNTKIYTGNVIVSPSSSPVEEDEGQVATPLQPNTCSHSIPSFLARVTEADSDDEESVEGDTNITTTLNPLRPGRVFEIDMPMDELRRGGGGDKEGGEEDHVYGVNSPLAAYSCKGGAQKINPKTTRRNSTATCSVPGRRNSMSQYLLASSPTNSPTQETRNGGMVAFKDAGVIIPPTGDKAPSVSNTLLNNGVNNSNSSSSNNDQDLIATKGDDEDLKTQTPSYLRRNSM